MGESESLGVARGSGTSTPVLSVVMPTYNRLERLKLALDALASQTIDSSQFEVVVVSDGSSDGTDEYLASPLTPVPVRSAAQPNAGPAAARNHAVSLASAPLIVFLDDDVIASPQLLERHLQAHEEQRPRAVIGPMLNAAEFDYSPWVAWEQAMLEKQYSSMRRGDSRPTFAQFYTGNASVPRDLFLAAGGFNPALRRAEDTEFAFRLESLGVEFVFDAEAGGYHLAERSYRSWLASADIDGRNMVALAREGQGWRIRAMAEAHRRSNVLNRAVVTAFTPYPVIAKSAIQAMSAISTVSWKLSAPRLSAMALSGVNALSYSLGAADEYGGARALRASQRAAMAAEQLDEDQAIRAPRVAMILEQTLGHVTHSNNLQNLVPLDDRVDTYFRPIAYEVTGWRSRIPLFSNWTVRAGLRARRAIAALNELSDLSAIFIHTQVPATLVGRWMLRVPTVVSIDATPIQFDSLGTFYAHEVSNKALELLKQRLNRRCFHRAAHLISWSQWSKQSLIDDYGVQPSEVTVLAPGVDVARWARPIDAPRDPGVVRILFVGGDLERKGGSTLIEAFRRLRQARAGAAGSTPIELHLVTGADVPEEEGVVVHRGLTSNSQNLIDLYHRAHIFCLPTLGDCLPMVLSEAGAARLPLVSTDVGAISEIVRDGVTGLLVKPKDVDSLVTALSTLIDDAPLRKRLGDNAAELVAESFDAGMNARALVDVLLRVAGGDDRVAATSGPEPSVGA